MNESVEAIEEVAEAIEQFGNDITINRIAKGTFDPDTGDFIEVIDSVNTKSIIKSFSSFEQQNSEIHSDDLRFLLQTDSLSYDDLLVFETVEYKILNIDKKIMQNKVIYYVVQGRA